MSPRVTKLREFHRDTLAEALVTKDLYVEAGCPVCLTLNKDETYTVRVYGWRIN